MFNLLYPKECLICEKVGSWLCKKCQKKLVNTLPNCYICKTLSNQYKTHEMCLKDENLEKITTIWKYNEYGKKLIHAYKYKHRFKVGDYIYSLFEEKISASKNSNTVLIPMPSYKTKTLERGFNQTEIVAKLISEKLKIPLNTTTLLKVKSNVSQASLSYGEREANVKEIFQINEQEVRKIEKFSNILIVDDIITTGATLNEANKTLRKYISENTNVNGLCIFKGNFRKHESEKSLQPNTEKEEKIRENRKHS